jgi:signal transduction histidine kinase
MQLHIATEQVPASSSARPLLERILQLMGQVVDDGRAALRGLRSKEESSLSLEQAFISMRQDLADSGKVFYRVIVEGSPVELRAGVHYSVCRIGREALLNAFRHAQAKHIETEIEFSPDHLAVRVRDDGCGIDPEIVRLGRDGHWGLQGMRERAEEMGARLRLWSRPSAGTELELIVPGNIAYQIRSKSRIFRLLRRKSGSRAKTI